MRALLPLCLLLASCGQDESGFPAGVWQGTCSGDLTLEITLDLDADGVGTLVVSGDLEREEAVEATLGDEDWIRIDGAQVFLYEVDDTHHGGSYSVYSRLVLIGHGTGETVEGDCYDERTNSLAEDDSTWGDEGVLLLERVS